MSKLPDKTNLQSDASIMKLFLEEVLTRTDAISQLLISIEKTPQDTKLLNELMRTFHSLKGACKLVNLQNLVDLSHSVEEFFVAVINHKTEISSKALDVILMAGDYIKSLSKLKFEYENKETSSKLIELLAKITNNEEIDLVEPKIAKVEPVSSNIQDDSAKVSYEYLSKILSITEESLIENKRIQSAQEELSEIKINTQDAIFKLDNCILELENLSGTKRILETLKTLKKGLEASTKKLSNYSELALEVINKNSDLNNQLQRQALSTTMRPIRDILFPLPRMIRDLSKSLNKKMYLKISGESSMLDRKFMKRLETCIMHIVRNSCDHGVEKDYIRTALGKPETATISIEALHSRSMFLLNIKDDGAGIDIERLKKHIVAKNLSDMQTLEKMSDTEIYAFLFLPNFSMSETISDISGRGFGLDVVSSFMQEIGGQVSLSSALGEGTTFSLSLPITRSLLNVLIVRIDNQLYAFELDKIYKTMRVKKSELKNQSILNFQGKDIRIIDTKRALQLGKIDNQSDFKHLLIVELHEEFIALEVEEFLNEAELVLRDADKFLDKIPSVWAYAIDNNSMPIVVLNSQAIAANALKDNREQNAQGANKDILIAEDSTTIREKVATLLREQGYTVDTAVDGIDALNALKLNKYKLLISDIDMPRLNGFKLVERIRQIEYFSQMKIILLSYKDSESDMQTGMKVGANLYLTKANIDKKIFLKQIAKFIDKNNQ